VIVLMGICNINKCESVYSAVIKDEMQKINVNSGYCAKYRIPDNCTDNFNFDDEIGIIRAIKRERNSVAAKAAEAAETLTEREDIRRNDFCRNSRHGFLHCLFCRKCRRRCRENFENGNGNGEIEIITDEFIDHTNCYRFVNQSFCDNMMGKSNIDITNLNNNTAEKRIQIEQILKKYGKNI